MRAVKLIRYFSAFGLTSNTSTSKINVEFGGIDAPAPCSP